MVCEIITSIKFIGEMCIWLYLLQPCLFADLDLFVKSGAIYLNLYLNDISFLQINILELT
jgi:hypothetical protein